MAIPDSPAPAPHTPPSTVDIVVGSTPPVAAAATVPASPSPAPAARTPLRVVQLTIPLDGVDATDANGDDDGEGRVGREEKVKKKKKVHRRDSLDRREALLRGKEGSRRRRRWENDHFTANPYFTPPTSKDWIPAPHYNLVPPVPYQYAALWDHPELIRRREEAAAKARSSRPAPATVPRQLKQRVKKAHGAAGLVELLEKEVRAFVFGEPRPQRMEQEHDYDDDMVVVGRDEGEREVVVSDKDASSEEEIVFVSKREREYVKPKHIDLAGSKKMQDRGWIQRLVFEGAVEDSFARWIVHTIASYYGLTSWSVSSSSVAALPTGAQEMRYSFVGMKVRDEIRERRPLYLQL